MERSLEAVTDCLRAPEGCRVVPGLADEEYSLTLTTSIAGGLVAGFVSRLPAQASAAACSTGLGCR